MPGSTCRARSSTPAGAALNKCWIHTDDIASAPDIELQPTDRLPSHCAARVADTPLRVPAGRHDDERGGRDSSNSPHARGCGGSRTSDLNCRRPSGTPMPASTRCRRRTGALRGDDPSIGSFAPVMWRSPDGSPWERVDLDDSDASVGSMQAVTHPPLPSLGAMTPRTSPARNRPKAVSQSSASYRKCQRHLDTLPRRQAGRFHDHGQRDTRVTRVTRG